MTLLLEKRGLIGTSKTNSKDDVIESNVENIENKLHSPLAVDEDDVKGIPTLPDSDQVD